jgi:hypothetical protein
MIKLKTLISESFEKVYDKYDKKDYFGTNDLVKTQIGNWKRAKEQGQKGVEDYTEKSIESIVRDNQKALAKQTYDKLATAIKKKDMKYLKSVLRHDQKYTIELFQDITGETLPRTTKDISKKLDDLYND